MYIRNMLKDDISLVHTFPPADWNADYSKILKKHFDETYFHPIVAINAENQIVGTAFGLIFDKSIWLGYVIVPRVHRNQGIGSMITDYLIKYGRSQNIQSAQLFATDMGKPVYEKAGFKFSGQYHYFEGEQIANRPPNWHLIHQNDQQDFDSICQLDQQVMDEDRSEFIRKYYLTGWKYCKPNGKLSGVFLPELENGLIISQDNEAGLNLLHYKHHLTKTTSIIPEQNTIAIQFLMRYGYKQTKSIPRMIYGKSIYWKGNQIFSRGTPYTG